MMKKGWPAATGLPVNLQVQGQACLPRQDNTPLNSNMYGR